MGEVSNKMNHEIPFKKQILCILRVVENSGDSGLSSKQSTKFLLVSFKLRSTREQVAKLSVQS